MLNVFVKMIPIRREAGLERRAEVYVYDEAKLTPLFTYDPVGDEVVLRPGVGSPVRYFNFFKRVSLAHGVTLDYLEREYECMRRIVAEVYREAKAADPTLEKPDVCELAELLYRRLREAGFH
jgi:hypothetical protein